MSCCHFCHTIVMVLVEVREMISVDRGNGLLSHPEGPML